MELKLNLDGKLDTSKKRQVRQHALSGSGLPVFLYFSFFPTIEDWNVSKPKMIIDSNVQLKKNQL